MIEYINGNLLDFPKDINVIAHSCNSQGVMGSGIALSIKEEYPAAYEVYMEAHKKGELILGTFTVAQLNIGKRIVNLVTQERYGGDQKRYVDYEAFYVALKTLRDVLENAQKDGRSYVLGLPHFISSARAGGSWFIIQAMIVDLFSASSVKCYIVKLPTRKPKPAAEVIDAPVESSPVVSPTPAPEIQQESKSNEQAK